MIAIACLIAGILTALTVPWLQSHLETWAQNHPRLP